MNNTVAFVLEDEYLKQRGLSQTRNKRGRDEGNNTDQKILLWMTIFCACKIVYQKNILSFSLHPYSSLENCWQGDQHKCLK
jgi:hypothetical protein